MKQLLVVAPVPVTAASTRFRLAQFFPGLESAGIRPVLRPFLDEAGFDVLYRRGSLEKKARAGATAILGRVADLYRAAKADGVLVHREAALVGPPLFERAFKQLGPMLLDIDDAIWVPYASPTYGRRLSQLLKAPGKIEFSLAAADHVIVGNDFLRGYVSERNQNLTVIPTVVDTDVFRPLARVNRTVPVLGWIGTHSTVQYLEAITPALQELAKRRPFVLRVIGGHYQAEGVPTELQDWTLETDVSDFQSLDVGLYPLVEDPWSVGKSGFKAIQYMACGVPVVASPVGVTVDMIRDGENGFLAGDLATWVDRLEQLIASASLRARLGDAGRADVLQRWSRAVHEPRFVETISRYL
jgi:glycosyltransferase involved in cell wall biosynthesis